MRRLRQPRYLIGSVVGVLYFYQVLFSRGGAGRLASRLSSGAESVVDALPALGAIAIVVMAGVEWAWPFRKRPPVAFSPSEEQFLFAAPLSDRALMRYLVLRSQLGILIIGAIMTAVSRPSSFARGAMLFVGLVIVIAVVQLHSAGIVLRRFPGAAPRRGGVIRFAPPLFVTAVLVALGAAVVTDWPRLTGVNGVAAMVDAARALATSGVAGTLLWPFVTLVRLPLADSAATLATALPVALGFLLANYAWTMTSGVEVQSLTAGARPAERPGHAQVAYKRRAPPFTLRPAGRPEIAILWKNLVMMGRGWSVAFLVPLLAFFVLLGAVLGQVAQARGGAAAFAVVCLVATVFTVVLGPSIAQGDLRQDLRHLEVLKIWPVRGAAIVRGELLAPFLVLSALAAVFISGATAFGTSLAAQTMGGAVGSISTGISAMLVAPSIILMQLTLQNAAALAFPAWVVTGPRRRAAGIDMMGQRMLTMAGLLAALTVCLVPPAIAGGLVGYGIYAVTGAVTVLPAAAVASAVIVAECVIGTEALGALLDRTDVSALDAE